MFRKAWNIFVILMGCLLSWLLNPLTATANELLTPEISVVDVGNAKESPRNAILAPDYALEFFGKQYVQIPNVFYGGNHPLTIEARVLPKKVEYSSIVANFQNAGVGLEIGSSGYWEFEFYDGVQYRMVSSVEPVKVNEPVYLAGVFDGSELMLFVNGSLQGDPVKVKGRHRASPFSFMVGADPKTPNISEKFFTGIIDEVRISNSSRYKADYKPTASLEKDESTLVLYHFSKGQGEIAEDSSGNGRHGKIHGGNGWINPNWTAANSSKKLRQVLIAAREKSGMTREELARKIRRSALFIERFEKGETQLDVVELAHILRVLNIDPGEFLKQLE